MVFSENINCFPDKDTDGKKGETNVGLIHKSLFLNIIGTTI